MLKSFNGYSVLKDVSIQCSGGEVCGLIGANGAGKTTLFKILLGLLSADSGSVKINTSHSKPIGGIVEKPSLYGYLNAYDNLKVFGSIQGLKIDKTTAQQQLLKVGLSLDRIDPVKNYSLGMKQRLGIAIALLNDPKVLILDEPFSGLDPLGIISLKKLILSLASKDRIAIIISSHIVEHLFKICDTLFVIKEGEISTYAPTNKVKYAIMASNIKQSKVLSNYKTLFEDDRVIVSDDKCELVSVAPVQELDLDIQLDDDVWVCSVGNDYEVHDKIIDGKPEHPEKLLVYIEPMIISIYEKAETG